MLLSNVLVSSYSHLNLSTSHDGTCCNPPTLLDAMNASMLTLPYETFTAILSDCSLLIHV